MPGAREGPPAQGRVDGSVRQAERLPDLPSEGD